VEHVVAVSPPDLVLRLEVFHAHDTVFLLELALYLSVFYDVRVACDDLFSLLGDLLVLPPIRGHDPPIDNGLLLRPQVLGDPLPSLGVGTPAQLILPACSICHRLEIRVQEKLDASHRLLDVLVVVETVADRRRPGEGFLIGRLQGLDPHGVVGVKV
jgi:hypothetical protein